MQEPAFLVSNTAPCLHVSQRSKCSSRHHARSPLRSTCGQSTITRCICGRSSHRATELSWAQTRTPATRAGGTLRAVSCARAAATRTAGSLVEGLDGPVSVIPSNERILVSSMKGINCLDFVHEMGSEPSFCTIEWDSSTLIAMGMAKWNLSSIRRKIATAST